MLLHDVLLPEYDRETSMTRCLLERVPEARRDWRPHDTSMPLGHLASHVADLPRWVDIIMTRDAYDLSADPPEPVAMTSTEELLHRFDQHVSSARGLLAETVDGHLSTPWTLRRGTHEVFRLPRIGVLRYFVLNHLVHHRGQLCVYLRMQNVSIPAVYGPAASGVLG